MQVTIMLESIVKLKATQTHSALFTPTVREVRSLRAVKPAGLIVDKETHRWQKCRGPVDSVVFRWLLLFKLAP